MDEDWWNKVSTSGRPKPALSEDTEFFWTSAQAHELAIQRCLSCQAVRHPPGPACPKCHSLAWDSVVASGRGHLYTYAVHHYPPVPGFPHPTIVGVVELVEGPRVVSNIVGTSPDELKIGDELEVFFADQEEGWTVPQFRRVAGAS